MKAGSEKITTKNLLNLLSAAICLLIVFGCKASSDAPNAGKTSDNTQYRTPDAYSTPNRASTPSPNKLIGTWTGKSANGTSDIKMIFTADEWTLFAGGKSMGSRKYTLIDDHTIEVETKDGDKFSMETVVSGDTLKTDMQGTKLVLKRAS